MKMMQSVLGKLHMRFVVLLVSFATIDIKVLELNIVKLFRFFLQFVNNYCH